VAARKPRRDPKGYRNTCPGLFDLTRASGFSKNNLERLPKQWRPNALPLISINNSHNASRHLEASYERSSSMRESPDLTVR
jgi:hypothetical protein